MRLYIFMCPPVNVRCVSIAPAEFEQRASTFASRKCLRHYTQRRRRKKKGRSFATKGQSKLLTGSHGNRGKTDKGLPRQATFRLQRKTLPFNLCRFVSSRDNREVMQRNKNDWEVNHHRYACEARSPFISMHWVTEINILWYVSKIYFYF